ncbi:MAG TPA: hypothetical protein VJ487_19840 [Alphaproteobacteria bacterium]|nr:hypothetical protein [Alphaproteobacteria bacterium]
MHAITISPATSTPTLRGAVAHERKLVKPYCHAAVTQRLEGEELAEIGLLKKAGALAFTDRRRA